MPEAVIDPLFDPDVVEDPRDHSSLLRETDPVHEIPVTGTFLVTGIDLIHEAVARTGDFSSVSTRFLHVHGNGDAPGLRDVLPDVETDASQGTVLVTADPPDHGRQRKLVTRRLRLVSLPSVTRQRTSAWELSPMTAGAPRAFVRHDRRLAAAGI
jgi:cytochrome P450